MIPPSAGSGRRRGVSLLELLVALALLMALVGIVLVAGGAARQRFRQGVCVQNLRKIGEMIHLYSIDHGGEIFPGSNTRGTWSSLMAEAYLKQPMTAAAQRRWEVFYCPELVALGHKGNSGPVGGYWTTYCINGKVMGTGAGIGAAARPIRKMAEFETPSRVGLMWDACTSVSGPPNRSVAAGAAYHIQAGNPNQGVGFVHGATDPLKRRGGRAVTLFLDGHAAPLADPGDGNHLDIQHTGVNLW